MSDGSKSWLFMHLGGLPAAEIQKAVTGKVEIFVDDAQVRFEEVRATDGVHDVIVFDAGTTQINNTTVYGFRPGEDFVIFRRMDGQELYLGGERINTAATPAGRDHPADGGIVLAGQPYNVDLMNNDWILPRHRFDIHFEGTIIG